MKLRNLLSLATASAATMLVALCAPQSAQAQFPGGGGGGAFFTAANSFMGGMFSNATGSMDPSHSSVIEIIKRDDVRSELFVDGPQREKMMDMDKQQQQQMMQTIQDMQPKIQEFVTGLQGLSQEERQSKSQEFFGTVQTTLQQSQTDQEKKLETILRPGQMKRLHELDLRWRGPLAVSDDKVAEPYNFTTDQKAKIAEILKEFRETQRKSMTGMQALRPATAGAAGNAQTAPNQGTPPGRPTQEDMQKRMEEMMKETDKARKIGGDKVLALLTPEQAAKWQASIGKPFKFRKIVN